MISKFDALALRLARLTSGEKPGQRVKAFTHDQTPRAVYDAYDSIDSKAAAILQHVSIMIAVSSILFVEASQRFLKNIFVCELLLYICLALSCLRLLMNQDVFRDQNKNVVAKEDVLDLTAKVTFLLSIVLVITVIAEVLIIYAKAPQ
jgi:hypothetical protein